MSACITLAQFQKICLAVGTVVSAEINAKAKVPAYLISLDMGPKLLEEHEALYKKRGYTSSAQLCANHTVEELRGSSVLCVLNFPRKQIGPNMSDCLVTGVQMPGLDPDAKRGTTVYMRPTCDVPPGSRVGLFGKDEGLTTNPRDLTWDGFMLADLRIGTVTKCDRVVLDAAQSAMRLLLQIDFGEKVLPSAALVKEGFPTEQLLGRQVLALTNLCSEDLAACFGSEAVAVVCSIAGRALLEPAKPVRNGFKLA